LVLSATPVIVTIASIGWPSGRNAQWAAVMTHCGAITVPVQPAALSILPSSSPLPRGPPAPAGG
jgi:hypothetical protein